MNNRFLPILKRKWTTASAIVLNCENWAQVFFSRLLPGSYQGAVRLKSGVVIHPRHNLTQSWGAIFEPAIADVYGLRAMPAPDVIWDIGANIGGFSCVAGHVFPGAVIVAYEPDHDAVAALQKNIQVNNLDNVTVIPSPVTKDGRVVEFAVIGGGGSSNIYSMGQGSKTKIQSAALSLQELSSAQRLFIKCDCEGAEGEIIEWVCARVNELPPKIQIVAEYHHWCPITPQQSLTYLNNAGFSAAWCMRFDELYLVATRNWT